jgi:hypothetical protein
LVSSFLVLQRDLSGAIQPPQPPLAVRAISPIVLLLDVLYEFDRHFCIKLPFG